MSTDYLGTGVSKGLDRGLLVYHDDVLLLEEGMGLGACALQSDGYTHFTSIISIKQTKESYEVVCGIDKRLEWKALGIKSNTLTRALEYFATNIYMKYQKGQVVLLKLGGISQKLFNVKASCVKVPKLGEVRITLIFQFRGS